MKLKKQSNLNKIVYFLVTIVFLFTFNLYCSSFFSQISQTSSQFIPGVNLNYMENTGAAFSILQNDKLVLIGFAIFAIIVILGYFFKHLKELSMMAIFMVSLLITGVSCNLYERIAFGFVRDYFELTFVNFPVFNISDIFINISVIVIIYMLFRKNRNEK